MTDLSVMDTLTIADALVERAHRRVTDPDAIRDICRALQAIGYREAADAVRRYADTMSELLVAANGDGLVARIDAYSGRV